MSNNGNNAPANNQTPSAVHVDINLGGNANNANANNNNNNNNNNHNDTGSDNNHSNHESGSNQSGNNNNGHGGQSHQPTNQSAIFLPTELPVGLLLFVNLLTFGIGIVALILLFSGIANGFIVAVDSPVVTLTDPSLEKVMVQTMTNGMVHFFMGALLIGIVTNGLNIAELYFPAVVAKHRVKQLVLNRLASGLALGYWIITLSSLPSYIGRKRSITAGSKSFDGYESNLAFWILLFCLAPFVALSHRLTPNENKRRFDRAGSGFENEEMSPFTHNAPDNY